MTFAPSASPDAPPEPSPCDEQIFEDEAFVVCVLPPDRYAISIAHNDGEARADAGVMDAVRARAAQDRPPTLAMNAGMYDADLDAIGLLIENGRLLHPLNSRDGPGNFHLKPNGVFAVEASGAARIVDSADWTPDPDIAF
ncbi:MAG: hypothetical protein EON85_10680, partial [Brevundimonas sp.]